MQIENSVFLVTGGGSGLGQASADMLLAAGARVLIADTQTPKTAAANDPTEAVFQATDVTDPDAVTAAIAAAKRRWGGLHGVINCAGIAPVGKVINKDGSAHDLALFNRGIQVNLVGTFNVVRLAAQAMLENTPSADGERGVIINTASVAAFDGQIGQASYAASKAGVAGMTLPLARELARHGIRVMAIAPGLFQTPMLAGLPEAAQASLAQQVPFPPRLGKPDEYAMLVRQIVENPMLNGEVIRLDGAIRMGPS